MQSNLNYLADRLAAGTLSISALDDSSGVVLDVAGERLLTMNATGIAIMQALQSDCRDRGQIALRLSEQFTISPSQAESDIDAFADAVSAQVKAGQRQ